MCGIAGFAGWERTSAISDAMLARMCEAIRHRGPDDEGHFVAPGVALGMRRLSIIDVAGGKQPIANEDGSVHVVFNGEIYNHHAIRAKLAAKHVLRTHADTEVLVHLYEEYGDRLMEHLRGMFGFAIWDARRRRLLVARDRVGIKPLYYWPTNEGVAFASELRSFLALSEFPRQLDRRSVEAYLAFGYVPDPKAIFAGVHKLPPGHYFTWEAGQGVQVREYWSPARPEIAVHDEREAIEELRRLLSDAVGSHLESEVPLGAFLSGGIDSSSVVAEMARQMSRPVQTFSIGFDDATFDEAPHAARVARALGTEHTELIVRPDADRLLEDVASSFDEPFGDSSALPMLLVSQLARQRVTVALSGDGGDELFAGYTRYAEVLNRTEVRPGLLRAVLRHTALRLPHSTLGRNRLLDLSRTRRGRYAATVAQALSIGEGGILGSVSDPSAQSLDTLLESEFASAHERDFVTQMTLVDMRTYLPGDILTKVDRASMSVSLEARVPLLDHHLIEFAVSLPGHIKYRDRQGKWILRSAVRGLVPDEVLSRPKWGFAVPLARWFRGELRHRLDAVLRRDASFYEFVDQASVSRLVKEHVAGRRDHSHLLWRLVSLDLWLKALRSGDLARPMVSSFASVA
jgi:asparagine synthase (glutamine-hydrolysing)